MYAIIADKGQQFKVEEGQQVEVAYRDLHKGASITFDQVLCVGGDDGTTVGQPTVTGASVEAEVVCVSQGPKLVVQKLRRRKNSRRRTGHRQLHTTVKINKIATA